MNDADLVGESEEVHKSGRNGAACHAQMYTTGTVLRHSSEVKKRQWLPQ